MDFDFAVLTNSNNPRSIVYNIDTGLEVSTFGIDQAGREMAQRVCETLNAYVAEHGLPEPENTAIKANIIKCERDRSGKELPPVVTEIEADSKDSLFGLFFRDYDNRYKFCNGIHFTFEDSALWQEYREWGKDSNNYAKNGGDMW